MITDIANTMLVVVIWNVSLKKIMADNGVELPILERHVAQIVS